VRVCMIVVDVRYTPSSTVFAMVDAPDGQAGGRLWLVAYRL